MNETSPDPLSPQEASLIAFTSLRFMLAGDIACHDSLEQIGERLPAINWDDPSFIRFSAEMRAGLPLLTPEQEASLRPSLLALVHLQTESLTNTDEFLTGQIAQLKKLIKIEADTRANVDRILSFQAKLLEVYQAMLNQLELLNVDVSPYALPEFP